ncbi:MAG: hypothetical protein HYV09_03225 [Deltaproteobacteria bacterium]|nr:hypothetical protein [Deltaproteobacteria bacterium]
MRTMYRSGHRRLMLAAIVGAGILAGHSRRAIGDTPPLPLPAAPSEVDYQLAYEERTGFVLSFEDQTVSLADGRALVAQTVAESQKYDTDDFFQWVEARTPASRKNVRVVRVYGDAPVYLYQGYALLPDSQDVPFPIDTFDAARDCRANPRCISLNRYDATNRGSNILVLAARSIVVRGRNQTLGLSLVTATENLIMPTYSDQIDLSARSDPAPSFVAEEKYDVGGSLPIVVVESAVEDERASPADRPSYHWPTHLDDLTWQFKRAQQLVDDNLDAASCAAIAKANVEVKPDLVEAEEFDRCLKAANPRGFAGLPGGSWLAFTFRATAIHARSNGQPGGTGGKGPPGAGAVKRCGTTSVCAEACNVYNPIDTSDPSCTVSCAYDYWNIGLTGGQAGPGGEVGFVRVAAVTHVSACDQFSPASLTNPKGGSDEIDRRCSDGIANDGDGDKIDCEASTCLNDQNVTVCDKSIDRLTGEWNPHAKYLKDLLASIKPNLPLGKVPNIAELNITKYYGAKTDAHLSQIDASEFVVVAPSQDGELSTPVHVKTSGPTLTVPPTLWGLESDISTKLTKSFVSDVMYLANEPLLESCGAAYDCDDVLRPFVKALAQPKTSREIRDLWLSSIANQTQSGTTVSLTPIEFKGVTSVVAQSGANAVVLSGSPWVLTGVKTKYGGAVTFPVTGLCVDDLRFNVRGKTGANGSPGEGGVGTTLTRYCPAVAPTADVVCHAVFRSQIVPPTGGSGEIGANFEIVYWPYEATQGCLPPTSTFLQDDLARKYGRSSGDLSKPDIAGSVLVTVEGVKVESGTACIPDSKRVYPVGHGVLCAPAAPSCAGSPLPFEGSANHKCRAYGGPVGKIAPPVTASPDSELRYWKRSDWARMIHGAMPLEMRRRLGKGNRYYKQAELLSATAKYVSTRRYVAANQGTFDCGLGSSSSTALDAASDATKRVCALRLELAMRLTQLAAGQNFFGYSADYVPPAQATFGELHRLASAEIDKAIANRGLWLTIGAVLRGEKKLDESIRVQIEAEIASLKGAYANGGALAKEYAGWNAAVKEQYAALRLLRESILKDKDGLATLKIKRAGTAEPDFAWEVIKFAVVAVAAYYGGPAAAGVAFSILEGTDTGDQGSTCIEGICPKYQVASATDVSSTGDKSKLAGDITEAKLSDTFKEAIKEYLPKLLAAGSESTATDTIGAIEIVGEKTYLKTAVEMKLLEAIRLARDLGQAWRARDLALTKILDAQRRSLSLQASLVSLGTLVTPGRLPGLDAQAAIVDSAYLSAVRATDAAGEYFFLARRAAERDTVPWNIAAGRSALSLAEEKDLLEAGPGKAGACFSKGVKVPTLDVNLGTIDCFKDRLDLIRNYVEAVESTYMRTGTLTVDVPITSDKLVTEGTRTFYRLKADIALGAPLLQRAQKMEKVALFVLAGGTDAARANIRVRRPMNDTYWIGKSLSSATDDVVQNFSFGLPATPGTAALDILLAPQYRFYDVTACVGPASAVEVIRDDCTLQRRTTSTGGVAVDPLVDRALVGDLDFEVEQSALAGRTPDRLRIVVSYRYRL